jgi:hypothetical protein
MPLGQFRHFEMKEIEELNAAALNDAKHYAESDATVLRMAGLEASGDTPVPLDADAREIVREAERWHARMIVLGSHGRRGFGRAHEAHPHPEAGQSRVHEVAAFLREVEARVIHSAL